VQRKPESFTEKFQAIQEEQSVRVKTGNALTNPFFWLACVALIVIIAAIVTASS